MNKERRTDFRIPLNLPARYHGFSGPQDARINDISLGGCFVTTRGHVDEGAPATIEIKLAGGQWLKLQGKVTVYKRGSGFGMVFTSITAAQKHALERLLMA